MRARTSSPTILLITGAWHVPEHYSLLSNRLRHLGYKVECPLLETNNNADPPNKNLDDDIAQIRDKALQILDSGSDIVAVMHSYGGVVGTNAFAGLGAADRNGSTTCVKGLIYMCSFVVLENESLTDIFGGGLPPWLHPNEKGTIDIDDPVQHFYHDISQAEQEKWVGRLVLHPTKAQYEAPKKSYGAAAWRKIPTTYLVCRNDQGLLELVQEMMIDRMQKAEEGLKVDHEYCDGSHSPFLSMPDRVAEVVAGVCTKVGA